MNQQADKISTLQGCRRGKPRDGILSRDKGTCCETDQKAQGSNGHYDLHADQKSEHRANNQNEGQNIMHKKEGPYPQSRSKARGDAGPSYGNLCFGA